MGINHSEIKNIEDQVEIRKIRHSQRNNTLVDLSYI